MSDTSCLSFSQKAPNVSTADTIGRRQVFASKSSSLPVSIPTSKSISMSSDESTVDSPLAAPRPQPEVAASITTMMMRNVPNKYAQKVLLNEFDQMGFGGTYDFFYLPMDFSSKANLGYCFVNFVSPPLAAAFRSCFEGRQLSRFESPKVITVHPAVVQGLYNNMNNFAKAAMSRISNPKFRPLVFQNGNRTEFSDLLVKLRKAPL